MAQAAAIHAAFSDVQAALELGGKVRKGEHGTKVHFVKQLQVPDRGADDSTSTRLIPNDARVYVFNVAMATSLPTHS